MRALVFRGLSVLAVVGLSACSSSGADSGPAPIDSSTSDTSSEPNSTVVRDDGPVPSNRIDLLSHSYLDDRCRVLIPAAETLLQVSPGAMESVRGGSSGCSLASAEGSQLELLYQLPSLYGDQFPGFDTAISAMILTEPEDTDVLRLMDIVERGHLSCGAEYFGYAEMRSATVGFELDSSVGWLAVDFPGGPPPDTRTTFSALLDVVDELACGDSLASSNLPPPTQREPVEGLSEAVYFDYFERRSGGAGTFDHVYGSLTWPERVESDSYCGDLRSKGFADFTDVPQYDSILSEVVCVLSNGEMVAIVEQGDVYFVGESDVRCNGAATHQKLRSAC